MRSAFITTLLLTALFAGRAEAGSGAAFSLSASYGKGVAVSPYFGATRSNVQIAPGVMFLDNILRVELGVLLLIPDVQTLPVDVEIRPSLIVDPPFFPLYLRLVAIGAADMLNDVAPTWGGYIGTSFDVAQLFIFGECGALPVGLVDEFKLEGRVGIGWHSD